MKGKALLSMLVLFALLGLISIVLSAEQNIQQDTSTTSDSVTAEGSAMPGLFGIQSPAELGVPIKLACGETKRVWTTPGRTPVFVFAAITSKEGSQMSVYTRTCNACPSVLAGEAHQDGVVVFGKFVEMDVKCENSGTCEFCVGDILTSNRFP